MTAPEHGGADVAGESPEPESQPVRRSLGFAAGSFVVGVVLGLGSSVLTSRLYGVRVIGEYALVSLPYVFCSSLSSVAEGTAFVREVAGLPRRHPRVGALWRVVAGFNLLLTTVVGLVALLASALLLRGPVDRPDLLLPATVILAGYVLVDNVGWNIDHVLSAYRAASSLFVVRLAQMGTFLLASVGWFWIDPSVWGLVWGTLLSFAVPLLVRLAVLPRFLAIRLPKGSVAAARHELPALLRFGVKLIPSMLGSAVSTQIGTWVVGGVGTVAQTGAYSRALGLASKFAEAGYRISEILMPGMVERRRWDDDDGARRLLRRTVRVVAVALIVVAASGSGAARGVMAVFGSGFERAGTALALLLTGYVLAVVASVQSQGLLAWGHPGAVARVALGRVAVVVTTVYPLGQQLGISGVALSFLLGSVVAVLANERNLGRIVGTRALGADGLARLVGTYAAGVVAARLTLELGDGIVFTALALAAGCAVGGLVALLSGAVTAEERADLLQVVGTRMRRSPAGG